MFKKYNDTPAAIAMGLYLLGALVYGLQLIFTSESWLTAHDIGPEGIPLARALGAAYLGFSLGVILTFVNSPDGQKTFFMALAAAQLILLVVLWHACIAEIGSVLLQDVVAVSVLTAVLLFAYFRLRSRL